MAQLALFDDPKLPEGFRYQADLITRDQEAALVRRFAELPFKPFEFQGFLGKRRVTSFGWRYDFNGGGLTNMVDRVAALGGTLKVTSAPGAGTRVSGTCPAHATE